MGHDLFFPNGTLVHYTGVKDAKECHMKCREYEGCHYWTINYVHGRKGNVTMCFLKV